MSEAPSVDEFLPSRRGASEEEITPEAQVISGMRDYVAAVRAYLKELHQGGESGRAVNAANSDAVDRLIRRIFQNVEQEYYSQGATYGDRVSVIAVGGYGRREMSLHSDVDLLLLFSGEVDEYVQTIAERMQSRLWDAGLTVGCALRTIDETIALGLEDETVLTALLDARFIVGDVGLFHNLVDAVRVSLVPDALAFIDRRKVDVRSRHKKYGESLYLLQPNVKEGAGGLRDYHNAYWIARATYPLLKGLDDFLHFGLLTETEMDEMRAALDLHWRVRNELHFIIGRKSDEMTFEIQERVAESLGYGELVKGTDELPVERFMGDYYRHARVISGFALLIVGQCRIGARPKDHLPEVKEVDHGFRIVDGQIEIPHSSLLTEKPLRLLQVFEVAQKFDVRLSRTAQRFVRESLDLIDEEFRRDPEAGQSFIRILSAESRVMRTIMTMNEIGFLSRYIPEWEHVVCLWQQVIYHTYTVDVHSIFLIEELRRLGKREYERYLPQLTEIVNSVPDFAVLFLGCLFHDIGKGLGGNHSVKGAPLARGFLERIGLEEERIERVMFLITNHLMMSHLAQRRDLSDPKLIVQFASVVGDRENLRNLYLLTFADIRASSPKGWTAWKGQLLRDLYEQTSEFLETGEGDPTRAIEQAERRIERLRDTARAELRGIGVGDDKIDAFFSGMPRRYFISHTPRQIARHAMVAFSFQIDQIMATSVRTIRGGFAEFIVCTRNKPAVYSKVAGVLTMKGVNILGSNIYTSREELALQIYRLEVPKGGQEEQHLLWCGVDNSIHAVLSGAATVEELMERSSWRAVEHPGLRRGQSVTILNEESDFYTIVDVRADDRKGLLYDITRAIAGMELEVYISKASTVLDQVSDAFYLKESNGQKITDPERLEEIRCVLTKVIEGGQDKDSG